ncbi:MAG: hypothetical protein D6694_07375 [Gammaproteobacteria bacterium]|nr:MAG: hypothetical protein D6694_07375 [Gammaproteobacteria bacterium]
MNAFISAAFYDHRANDDMPPTWKEAITKAHIEHSPHYQFLEHVTCLYQWDEGSPLCAIDIALNGTSCFIVDNTQVLWDTIYKDAYVSLGMPCDQIGTCFEEFYYTTKERWTISPLALRHLRKGTYTKDTVSCTSFARLALPELRRDAFTAGGLYKEMLRLRNGTL